MQVVLYTFMNNSLKVNVLGHPELSASVLVYGTLTKQREAHHSSSNFYEHFRENNMNKN
jgi:hypothetical protein